MEYKKVEEHLIYNFKSEDELVKSILRVSNDFTREREKLGEYLEDKKFVAAYTAFYFTTNYPKFDLILKKVNGLEDIIKKCEVVEIGSGPGSFSFSISKYTEKLVAVETSKLMREQAEALKSNLFKSSNLEFVSSVHKVEDKIKPRVVIFTNSFNEMSEEDAYSYIKLLKADYVLFIEPGTMELFHRLLKMRSKLIQKKYNILYPCALNTDCPLAEKDDWCHQYLKVDLDMEVKRLSQLVKINRKWQAACIHLYSLDEEEREDQTIILRTFSKTKFSKDWQLCSKNEILEFKNFKKDYSKDDYKELDEKLAGDIVKFETIKTLKSGEIRGKLQ